MKVARGVMSSDKVNRYGSRFTAGSLCSALVDTHRRGMPSLISHDFTRPLGWTRTTAVHFEPGCTRLLNESYLPETASDWDEVKQVHIDAYLLQCREMEPQLQELRRILGAHATDIAIPLPAECVSLHEPGIARRAAEVVFGNEDDDGLIELSRLTPIGPGVYRFGQLALFAHSFFRRSLALRNSLNGPFIGRLHSLDQQRTRPRIKLDPDLIGLASTHRQRIELQYWHGPKFNNDLTRIPRGVTRHEATEDQRLYHSISRTEFWWKRHDGQHTLEAEELRDQPTFSMEAEEDQFGCRYVHSIVDDDSGKIVHFDGAIRMYSTERIVKRLEQDIDSVRRDLQYTKLWRIDGDIDLADWKALLSHHFRDNPLVGEYLGADAEVPSAVGEAPPAPPPEDERRKLEATDGVRITLSFGERKIEDVPPADLFIEALVFREEDGTKRDYVETWAYELVKVLRREGLDIHVPMTMGCVSPEDRYVNLPMMRLGRQTSTENLRKVRRGLQTFLRGLEHRIPDSVVSSHISLLVEDDLRARLSMVGHVAPLIAWLDEDIALPPIGVHGLNSWGTSVADTLADKFKLADGFPATFALVSTSGLLGLPRTTFPDAPFTLAREGDRVIVTQLAIPKAHDHIATAIAAGTLSAAVAMEPRSLTCARCNADFKSCNCSVLLDGAQIVCEQPEPAYAFVTDRPL